MNSQKVKNRSFMSFPQRRESSLYKGFWTPAFAGVTAWGTFYEAIKTGKHEKGREEGQNQEWSDAATVQGSRCTVHGWL
jgi:hypothetical protein